MTDLTNAPPLPVEPEWYAAMRRAGSPHIEYVDTLRDQLSEAQKEIEQLGKRYDRIVDQQKIENYEELLDSIDKWAARADANEKDARRYRWLVGKLFEMSLYIAREPSGQMAICNQGFSLGTGSGIDAAIDAALAKS